MKYKVMYTAGAKKDLRIIFRYISEELLDDVNDRMCRELKYQFNGFPFG